MTCKIKNIHVNLWGVIIPIYPNIGRSMTINTLRPRRNEQHFADDISKRIFFNENVWISIKLSLKFVPKGPINNIPALVQIMAWCRSGDKPLSEPMMVSLPTHICVTRPQWVKGHWMRENTDVIVTYTQHWYFSLNVEICWRIFSPQKSQSLIDI